MSRNRWHITATDESYALSRHMPLRFDLAAETLFPAVHRGRLARQVRQDMWRALRRLRGFSPAVLIRAEGEGLHLTAGGRVQGPVPANTRGVLENLLSNPVNRQRWLDWARRPSQDA